MARPHAAKAPARRTVAVPPAPRRAAPHLHLHVINVPSAIGADGLPYVFDRFTLVGQLDAEQWYAADSGLGDSYRILPGDGSGPRQNELPLDLRIVNVPPAAP